MKVINLQPTDIPKKIYITGLLHQLNFLNYNLKAKVTGLNVGPGEERQTCLPGDLSNSIVFVISF